MDEIGQHRAELLSFPAVDLVRAQDTAAGVSGGDGPTLRETVFSPTSLAPTDAVTNGRMGGRHRLTIQANALAQATRDARVAVSERDTLGTNAAGPTPDAALRIP